MIIAVKKDNTDNNKMKVWGTVTIRKKGENLEFFLCIREIWQPCLYVTRK